MAIPTKDAELVTFVSNMSTRITASPTTFACTTAQASSLASAKDAFITAYNAQKEAIDAGNRSVSLTTAKNSAKDALLLIGREMYGVIQNSPAVTDENKNLVGVKVRSAPTRLDAREEPSRPHRARDCGSPRPSSSRQRRKSPIVRRSKPIRS